MRHSLARSHGPQILLNNVVVTDMWMGTTVPCSELVEGTRCLRLNPPSAALGFAQAVSALHGRGARHPDHWKRCLPAVPWHGNGWLSHQRASRPNGSGKTIRSQLRRTRRREIRAEQGSTGTPESAAICATGCGDNAAVLMARLA